MAFALDQLFGKNRLSKIESKKSCLFGGQEAKKTGYFLKKSRVSLGIDKASSNPIQSITQNQNLAKQGTDDGSFS